MHCGTRNISLKPTLLCSQPYMSSRGEATEPPTQTRSCHECSRRKVRCDRHQPCRHCSRTGVQCVYPRFRRRPTKRPVPSGSRPDARISNRSNGSQAGDGSQESPRSARPAEPHWLIRDQQRSRYIGNTFWTNMSRDVRTVCYIYAIVLFLIVYNRLPNGAMS